MVRSFGVVGERSASTVEVAGIYLPHIPLWYVYYVCRTFINGECTKFYGLDYKNGNCRLGKRAFKVQRENTRYTRDYAVNRCRGEFAKIILCLNKPNVSICSGIGCDKSSWW